MDLVPALAFDVGGSVEKPQRRIDPLLVLDDDRIVSDKLKRIRDVD